MNLIKVTGVLKGTSDAEAYRVEEPGTGQLSYSELLCCMICKTETFHWIAGKNIHCKCMKNKVLVKVG